MHLLLCGLLPPPPVVVVVVLVVVVVVVVVVVIVVVVVFVVAQECRRACPFWFAPLVDPTLRPFSLTRLRLGFVYSLTVSDSRMH